MSNLIDGIDKANEWYNRNYPYGLSIDESDLTTKDVYEINFNKRERSRVNNPR